MSILNREPASLLLEDGSLYEGYAFGARGDTAGEVVFNTSMTGYQEILTDPSYARQMVTMTYPHIGNYGVNPEDMESGKIHPSGFILRAPCDRPSNWRSEHSLESWLADSGVVGIAGIDTRALVRKIRDKGAMRGAIVSGVTSRAELQTRLDEEPSMEGRDLAQTVTCDEPYEWSEPLIQMAGEEYTRPQPKPPGRFHVVAYDFGVKRNILRLLVTHGCRVTVVPATTSAEEALALKPDGIFLSNGPGDPAAVTYAVATVKSLLGRLPIFGICLGHQIVALALGGRTFKMTFGHRGGNQPVDVVGAHRVEITSQNHGFAVSPDGLPDGVRVSHVNLNDGTVEVRAVPFLPFSTTEASPGPHDLKAYSEVRRNDGAHS